MTYLDQSLGQLARRIPGATRVFDQYQLDFCCAGNRTLRTAAGAAGIPPEPIVAELQALQLRAEESSERDWGAATDKELVAHLLGRYHAVHREQLPELIRLARRVEQVHGDRETCPHGLADHLTVMAHELESHMQKEELVLFPLILRQQGALAGMPIELMRQEHEGHGAELRRLAELTNNITAPRDACTTWRALYQGLRAFRDDLMAHIHTENNILFERFAPAQVH
ncbi:iron-sulfur cluster repair protein YtfE [Diaphorobacter ruginosibacter]|uniref:Iron-sulfur cluster repair protein YtfE n=1 Tax=Diaphorobacter ruginosibacter TaxID=1715720 RepID=A0A7G9RJ89_9BURK|nr:iron-sulfur cluster repair protein YtfE [Diaphorobacter ruginosibacter]QNN55664.1 iron-sulfur cluster repair protein YtfE [Diaphorobacter ruginosibacter]